jgi:hypothetical protein
VQPATMCATLHMRFLFVASTKNSAGHDLGLTTTPS